MVLALSTAFARGGAASGLPPDALLDFVERAGAGGLFLDRSLPAGYVEALLARWLPRRGALPVVGIENVCPSSRAQAAALCSTERDEADAAVQAATATVRLAGRLGAGTGITVALSLGEVAALHREWPGVRRAFSRGLLDADPRRRERAQRARAAAAARCLDPARRSLERLARVAESEGVVLGVRNPARPHGLPSAAELAGVLAELLGAPIGPLLDAPAAHLVDVMGFTPLAETLVAWTRPTLALVADACGAVAGLAPGSGELDLDAVLRAVTGTQHVVFAAAVGLTERELLAGVADLAGRLRSK